MDPHQARIRAKYLKEQQEKIKLRRGSRWLGATLGATALAIYFYSMYTIKQETVLREIDDELNK